MTNGNESAYPEVNHDNPQFSHPTYGLSKREYFASNQDIPWSQAAVQVEQKLGKQGTIEEVAKYLARMKVIAADELINALNEKNGKTLQP